MLSYELDKSKENRSFYLSLSPILILVMRTILDVTFFSDVILYKPLCMNVQNEDINKLSNLSIHVKLYANYVRIII